MQETEVTEDHHALFTDNCHLAYGYYGTPLFLDNTSFTTLSEFNDRPEEKVAYEEEQLLPGGWGNWRWDYDSFFSGLWGDRFVSNGDAKNDNWHFGNVVKGEDSYHVEEKYEGSSGCCEDAYYQGDADYNPWPGYGYGDDEDSYSYNGDEHKSWCRYDTDEIGFFASVFGYFPCLLKEQEPYGE